MLTINQRGLVRTSVSGTEPITLAEAKLYLRVDGTSEDSLIADLITAVREHAEEYLKRSIVAQTWQLTLDDYAPKRVYLPKGPVSAVNSVNIIDNRGNSEAVNSEMYQLVPGRDELEITQIIYAHHVQIEYQTGHANSSDVPRSINYGMLSHLAALYDCRGESSVAIPADAMALYAAHREVRL